MELVGFIGKLLLFFIGAQYVVGPILVWRSQKFPQAYRFDELGPRKMEAESSIAYKKLHQKIIATGFEYIGSSELKMSQSKTLFSLFYNAETTLSCTLSSVFSQPASSTQVEFTQMYEDGSLTNVNNNPLFHIYPKWDKKTVYRFPKLNSISGLLKAANTLRGKTETAKRAGYEKDRMFEIVEKHLNKELDRLVELEWVSSRVEGGERSLTIKGAILMTWQLCWPVKVILGTLDERRSVKALKI